MHTHIKGRIFQAEGTSFLVLHEDAAAPGQVRVKEIGRRKSVQTMSVADVARRLAPRAVDGR